MTCSDASTVASRAVAGTSPESGHIRGEVCYRALLPEAFVVEVVAHNDVSPADSRKAFNCESRDSH